MRSGYVPPPLPPSAPGAPPPWPPSFPQAPSYTPPPLPGPDSSGNNSQAFHNNHSDHNPQFAGGSPPLPPAPPGNPPLPPPPLPGQPPLPPVRPRWFSCYVGVIFCFSGVTQGVIELLLSLRDNDECAKLDVCLVVVVFVGYLFCFVCVCVRAFGLLLSYSTSKRHSNFFLSSVHFSRIVIIVVNFTDRSSTRYL